MKQAPRKLFFPIAFSLCWHLACFLIILIVYTTLNLRRPPHKNLMEIELERLNDYRTVGEKEGSKNFSEKVIHPGEKADMNQEGNPRVSLSDLSSGKTPSEAQMPSSKTDSGIVISRGSEIGAPSFKQRQKEQDMSSRLLKELSINDDDAKALKVAGLNIDFTPPKGVAEDELNPTEKMFYSFQKRTFVSYVNSFLKAYNDIMVTRPNFKKTFLTEKHTMVGKVTFDKQGNVIAIKILQWSLNDDMEKLFEATLENIHALPNPPRAFFKDEDQFSMYYQLKING